MPLLGRRFEEALVCATRLHATQQRKGSATPYLAHLLGVASLVLEDGGTEDEAIAALLHDAVEDQGGAPTLAAIRERFGDTVARIVDGCTDTDVTPKPPWRERKERYIAHLSGAPEDVVRVSLADKVHNARSISMDLARVGEVVWNRFKASREETLWYYHAVIDAVKDRYQGHLLNELVVTIQRIEGT
ncbi:MAG TPA: HD domain-containing protein [Candidatus Xenobia bacterium]|jgi:(p)ppGpp synthase/HD superfamily hydrolase